MRQKIHSTGLANIPAACVHKVSNYSGTKRPFTGMLGRPWSLATSMLWWLWDAEADLQRNGEGKPSWNCLSTPGIQLPMACILNNLDGCDNYVF